MTFGDHKPTAVLFQLSDSAGHVCEVKICPVCKTLWPCAINDAYEEGRAASLSLYHENDCLHRLFDSLDRCRHGRHESDLCFDCETGISKGNPLLRPGTNIGYTIYGEQIRIPLEREDRSDPEKWVVKDG